MAGKRSMPYPAFSFKIKTQNTGRRTSLGQASFEQLIVISLGLALLSVMFYFGATYASDSIKISQVDDAVKRLSAAADYVYTLGPNSKEYVDVYFPEDIRNTSVSGKRISIRVGTSAGVSDAFGATKADLLGSIPVRSGRQKILVQYLESGKVLIGQAGLLCSPTTLTRVFNVSQVGSDKINISNTADFNVTGINWTFNGSASSKTSISGVPSSLTAGAQNNITVTYSSGSTPGLYTGVLSIQSANDGACSVSVNVYVNSAESCSGLCLFDGYNTGTCRGSNTSCSSHDEDYMPDNDFGCVSGPRYCCCGPSRDTRGPRVDSMRTQPANPDTNDQVSIIATCDDTYYGGSDIVSAQFKKNGESSWTTVTVTGGSSPRKNVSYSVGKLPEGYNIGWARCTDSYNNTGPVSNYLFNVEDS